MVVFHIESSHKNVHSILNNELWTESHSNVSIDQYSKNNAESNI